MGKSNVGKSSLINAICQRKQVARVSNTPGRTQQINFFEVDQMLFVDLPGYGYAKVPQNMRTDWEKLIIHYLQCRPTLLFVLLLVDGRRGIKEHDKAVMDLFDRFGINFYIVYTKCDKLLRSELSQLRSHASTFQVSMKDQVALGQLRAFINDEVAKYDQHQDNG